MKQVHKYIISVFGKYHSEYDNESDAQNAVNEQIHFVFGLPVQYQTLETTLEGTIL